METKKRMYLAMLAGMLLSGFTPLLAQVKVGTSPTVIAPNNNLEVEASTAGRKTSIDKVTGQLTIADGTQATGNVFTSDANGGGSWQPSIRSMTVAKSNVGTAVPANTGAVYTKINFDISVFDRGGNFSMATDTYTAPTTGIYYVKGSVNFPQIPSTNQVWISVLKQGVLYQHIYADPAVPGNTALAGSGSCMIFLLAGEAVTLTAVSNVAITTGLSTIEIANMSN